MSGSTTPDPFAQAVSGTPVPPWILAGLVRTESGGNPNARNDQSGAFGLGGFLPSTASQPGFGMQPLPAGANNDQQLKFAADYLSARGKDLGLKPEDWQDPTKAAAALIAYHGPQKDANGIDGVTYAMKALGLDPLTASSAFGTYQTMTAQTVNDIRAAGAEKAKAQGPIYDQMMADVAADKAQFNKAAKDYKPVEAIPPPTPPETDPLKSFGSAASIFAVIAAAFSKRPGLNAMVGLTGAINGTREADQAKFDRSLKLWKDQTTIAIQNHRLQSEDMAQALEKMKTDITVGTAMAKAVAARSDDQIATDMLAKGQYEDLAKLQDSRNAAVTKMVESYPLTRATLELAMAQASKDPAKIAAAQQAVAEAKSPTGKAGMMGSPEWKFKQFYDEAVAHGKAPGAEAAAAAQQKMNEVGAAGKGGGSAVTPEQLKSLGAQAATGQPLTQLVPGYGAAAASDRQKARQSAIDYIKTTTGKDDEQAGIELANRSIEFQSGKRSSGQLTTMLGATEQAVQQLDFNIKKTKEELAKLPSSDLSPILNAIARGEEKWTGDPAYSSAFYYMHATALESARILAGGQASVAQLHQGAMEEAQKWASLNMTPASFDAVAHAMTEEGNNRIDTFRTALKGQALTGQGQVSGAPPAAAPAPASPAAASTSGGVQVISDKAAYDALPAGTHYRKPGDPPGSYRTKQ
jgi:hypothetical protein